jgi:glycyl-tRNA synthetase beta chain
MRATLLVELLTEELPPKSLQRLSQSFCDELTRDLRADRFLAEGSASRALATPRRLAVLVTHVLERAPDEAVEVQGPSVKVGLDADGKPTQALAGFARKNGVEVDALVQIDTPKGRVFAARKLAAGSSLEATLGAKVASALHKLPIPKLMRWGDGDAQFVRPAHRLSMLHGERLVAGNVLGLASGRNTLGHRFMSAGEIALTSAETYQAQLETQGRVIADFAARRQAIDTALRAQAETRAASLGEYTDLLDEVAALVEHPSVYVGEFDAAFLEVPQECLILTMRQNQKYFPLFNAAGRLLPQFLIVSNMQVADASHIIGGNQRVVRPRLEDARFFYTQDRKTRLESRVPQLEKVVYHNKLGNQLERVMRVQQLAGRIARALGADAAHAERAAWLAKADLITGMVGEFPELQGTMGRYYALHDGEPAAVADAIEAHYRPRFAGDRLPEGHVACAVALADKLDTLVGIFGIGGAPTGDRDPFALRRHALGVLRILLEARLPLGLNALLADTVAVFAGTQLPAWSAGEVHGFMLERLRNLLRDHGHAPDEVDAVLNEALERIDLVPARLEAVRSFRALPEAGSLAAANKRIANILKKADESTQPAERALLTEPAEIALFDAVAALTPPVEASMAGGDYVSALTALAGARGAVDRFFEDVMVNVEDPAVRANRIALLRRLHALMNRVADISRLAA